MKKTLFMLFSTILLTYCSRASAEPTIRTAIVETQNSTSTATSTVTPTLIPLADIQFDSSIVKIEDLGLEYGKILRSIPNIWPMREVNGGINIFSQELLDKKENKFAGWVIISLYDSQDSMKADFGHIRQNAQKYLVDAGEKIGDDSFTFEEEGRNGVTFIRCQGLVHVFISWGYDMKTVSIYTKNLQSSLESVICR